MHTLQDQMLVHRNTRDPLLCRCAPSQEYNTVCSHFRHSVNDLLSQQLPTLAGVRVGFTTTHGQTCVEQQDTTICPWCEKARLVWRRLVVWVVDLEGFVDVLERGRGGCGWTDREAEAVGLVGTVVGVLACDDDFDGVKRCVTGPVQLLIAV
jgi:hypothetical protein